jgi:hypothetical protein
VTLARNLSGEFNPRSSRKSRSFLTKTRFRYAVLNTQVPWLQQKETVRYKLPQNLGKSSRMTPKRHEICTPIACLYKKLTNQKWKIVWASFRDNRRVTRTTARQAAPGRTFRAVCSSMSLCRALWVSGAVLRRNGQSVVAAGACYEGADPWVAGLGDARCDWC